MNEQQFRDFIQAHGQNPTVVEKAFLAYFGNQELQEWELPNKRVYYACMVTGVSIHEIQKWIEPLSYIERRMEALCVKKTSERTTGEIEDEHMLADSILVDLIRELANTDRESCSVSPVGVSEHIISMYESIYKYYV